MADDDENDDKRGSRDNAGKEHKPKQAQEYENALRGSVGTKRIFGPSLGRGGFVSSRQSTEVGEQTASQSQEQEAAKDDGPYAIETGVKEIDVKSIEDGYKLISQEKIDAQKGISEPDIGQEQGSDRAAWEKQQAEKIAFSRQASRDKDRGHGH